MVRSSGLTECVHRGANEATARPRLQGPLWTARRALIMFMDVPEGTPQNTRSPVNRSIPEVPVGA